MEHRIVGSAASQQRVALWYTICGTIAGAALLGWLSFIVGFDDPVIDEAIYAESAFRFASQGTFTVSEASAPTAVFETLFGGLSAAAGDLTYGALRTSSFILTLFGGVGMYSLVRTLGGTRLIASLGLAVFLGNPLMFTLSNTFMTDAHAVALSAISAALFARGLVARHRPALWLVGGSIFGSLAFLSRQQAIVIPVAAVLALGFDTRSTKKPTRALLIGGLPLASVIGYLLWSSLVEESAIRSWTWQAMTDRSPMEAAQIFAAGSVEGLQYSGLLLLPLLYPLTRLSRSAGRRLSSPLTVSAGAGLGILCVAALFIGLTTLEHQTWVTTTGFLGVDRAHLGQRPVLLGAVAQIVLHFVTYVVIWLWIRSWTRTPLSGSSVLNRFVLTSLFGTFVAAIVASLGNGAVLDRYWLPLLPLLLAAVLPRITATAKDLWPAWVLVVIVATITVVGTRDGFVAYQSSVEYANELVAEGLIPKDRIDGGASWAAIEFGVADIDLNGFPKPGPFWVSFYMPNARPDYGVALSTLEGYETVGRREYSSWLHVEPTYLYLLYRPNADGFYLRVEDF